MAAQRRRPPLSELDVFNARECALKAGDLKSVGQSSSSWVFNRFSFHELAKALHRKRLTFETFVDLYVEIMNDKNGRATERMAAADKLRECMMFAALSTKACIRQLGLGVAGPLVHEDEKRPAVVPPKAGSKFAQQFNQTA